MEIIDPWGLVDCTQRYLMVCRVVHGFNCVVVLLHLFHTLFTAIMFDRFLNIPPPFLPRVYQALSRGFVYLLNAKGSLAPDFHFLRADHRNRPFLSVNCYARFPVRHLPKLLVCPVVLVDVHVHHEVPKPRCHPVGECNRS